MTKRSENIDDEEKKAYRERIGRNFKRMIKVSGISHADVAAAMGYSQATINHKTNGRQNISCAFLLEFCEKFGFTIEPFFAENIEEYLLKKDGDKSEDMRTQTDMEVFLRVKTNDRQMMKQVRKLLEMEG